MSTVATAADYEQLTAQIADELLPDAVARRLFVAMIAQESGYDPEVVEGRRDSTAGARGIAQLMPVHWPRVDPLDPPAALRYAVGLLLDNRRLAADLLGEPAALSAAVAAYNAGWRTLTDAVRQQGGGWVEALPDETQAYLDAVLPAQVADQDGLWRDPVTGWVLPAAGPVTQGYGLTEFARSNPGLYGPGGHAGVDIGCATGTRVRATRAGEVTYAGLHNRAGQRVDDGSGYGGCVIVRDDAGAVHVYAHLSEWLGRVGGRVVRGDVVGRSGATGRSTGPHLHYEVRIDDRHVDPTPWLLPREVRPPRPALCELRVASSGGLNLRAAPADDGRIITTMADGSRVALLPDWLPVREGGGREGWAWGELLAADSRAMDIRRLLAARLIEAAGRALDGSVSDGDVLRLLRAAATQTLADVDVLSR